MKGRSSRTPAKSHNGVGGKARKSAAVAIKQTIRPYRFGTVTGRTYAEYEEAFGKILKRSDKVLDLGIGYSDFVAEARKRGIEAFGVDPALLRQVTRDRMPPKSKEYSAAALAEELPFRSSSFDSVVSHFGAIFYGDSGEKRRMILEALRVLKPHGILGVFPAMDIMLTHLKELKKLGFRVELKYRSDAKLPTLCTAFITKPSEQALQKLRKMWGMK